MQDEVKNSKTVKRDQVSGFQDQTCENYTSGFKSKTKLSS